MYIIVLLLAGDFPKSIFALQYVPRVYKLTEFHKVLQISVV